MSRGMKQMAEDIPHDTREKILLDWLPSAKASLSDKNFKLLWEAYFIYIEPNGIRKTDCPKCVQNVFNNWNLMRPALIKAEKRYNALEDI